MKSRITKTVALAALMAGSAGVASATEGWYGRADVGYSVDGEIDLDTTGASSSRDLESDWMGALGLGYAFDNGFRVDGEVSTRFNNIEPVGRPGFFGRANVWAAMLNGYYDFNREGSIQPYVGVGVGAARIDVGLAEHSTFTSIDDSDTALAYQGMAGVSVDLSDQLALDVGYRYFTIPEFEVAGRRNIGQTAVVVAPATYDGEYTHQAVTVGLRYQFAGAAPPPPPPPPPAPPPPPPPPPAPACPTSEFVVYFEWDRSNLNQAALETIDAAVARARQCNVSGVVVVGHTDTSGSPAYNQGLSERRASVVADALVARGIGAGSITRQARGETDLARATRDGVREPLNRRTAVTISFR
jgi:outer membrane protein OmpA-like peptidoglycan-associated protein